jgi:phospholipid-binding lipoprotein MlaA
VFRRGVAGLKTLFLPDRFRRRVVRTLAAIGIGAFALTGCATADGDMANDPFESVNRSVFDFNNKLDSAAFKPVAQAYADNVPADIRQIVTDALRYLKTPVIFANDVLQGNVDRAGNTLFRFVINTTIGFGGLVDTASATGAPYHSEDFGQTLGVWGVGEGPYLVIPLLGPMTLRDGFGKIGDSFIDPLGEINETAFDWSHRLVDGVDRRADLLDTLDELERTSLDYYAAIRSLVRQKRNDEISNGEGNLPIPVPNLSFDDEDEKKEPAVKQSALEIHMSWRPGR